MPPLATLATLLAVAGSFIYACVRVGMVAGRADSRMESLSNGLAELTESLQAFADRADDRLNDHGERIASLEGIERRRGGGARTMVDD